jgi:Zn2+/Cd2+-exporting ATPase
MKATVEREAGPASAGEAVYLIEKMDCPTEEGLLRKALEGVAGVRALRFNLMSRTLTVSHDLPDPAPITAAIDRLGMAPVLRSESAAAPAVTRDFGSGISRWQWIRMGVAGVLALGAEGLAFAGFGESGWPVVAMSLVAIALGGVETLKKGWIALKTLSLNMNLLMTIAVIGAALIGQWPEAAVVIWLFGIAEMIEALSLDRARNAIRKLMDLAPETALVRQPDGLWQEVKADAVPLAALVRVRPGERIALDGVVMSGASAVNQAPITGESMPVEKKAGDTVFAGTINERGALEFQVSARKGDTTLDRIARSVQEAQGQRAPTQRFVDKFASIYTPAVFALAIAIAVVPPLALGQPWFDWLYKALVMLVIACPCALVISTPVTVVSGLAAAARRGILVKGGLYLEQGRLLRAVALDKTGTLTQGRPALTDVLPLGALPEADVLRIAASLDGLSEHPVAAAIVGAYGDKRHAKVEHFEALAGRGVKGEIDGTLYYIGNQRLADELGVAAPRVRAAMERLEAEAKTAVVLATAEQALAVLAVADTRGRAGDADRRQPQDRRGRGRPGRRDRCASRDAAPGQAGGDRAVGATRTGGHGRRRRQRCAGAGQVEHRFRDGRRRHRHRDRNRRRGADAGRSAQAAGIHPAVQARGRRAESEHRLCNRHQGRLHGARLHRARRPVAGHPGRYGRQPGGCLQRPAAAEGSEGRGPAAWRLACPSAVRS